MVNPCMKSDILSEKAMSVIQSAVLQELLMSNIKISPSLYTAILLGHNPNYLYSYMTQ